MRRASIPVFLPLLGCLAAPSLAQSVLPYLSDNTLLAISVPDIDASIGEFSSMPLAKMWREKEVQDFVQDAKEMVLQQYQKAMDQAKQMHAAGRLPVDPEKLQSLRVKGLSFAITKLSMQIGDMGPMPEVGVMLQVDFGDTSKQWFELLQMGLGMLGQTGKFEREDLDVAGSKLIALKPTEAPPGLVMGLNVAMVGNSVIIGTLKDDLKSTIDNMQQGKKVLAASARYQAGVKHVNVDGAEAESFLRPDPWIDFAVQMAGIAAAQAPNLEWLDAEGVSRAFDALGLRSIHSLSMASTYQDGKSVTTSYAVCPAPERKGLLAGGNKDVDLSFLKWVPKDAVSFSASTIDPMSIYDALTAAVKAYDPKMSEMVMGHLAAMEKSVGFSLRDDLFGAIGDSTISWQMPMASFANAPEVAYLVKVNDPEKIVKVLKSLCAMSQGKVDLDESDKRGTKTYQFRINFSPTGGMGGMNPLEMFNPCFAFKDGYMVAAFQASDIRQVFKRMERTDDDPKSDIRGNKQFAAYMEKLPKNMQAVSFSDWKAQFESMYQIATSLLAFVPPNENIPLDMSMLPDASTLTKHLFGSISYTVADAEGMASTTVSPFGPEIYAMLVAVLAAGLGAANVLR